MALTKDHWNVTSGTCVAVNATAFPSYPDFDCCHGGWFQPVAFQRSYGLFVAWLLVLCWIFLGVAMGAEVFMASIEQITSKEVTRKVTTRSGKVKTFHVRVWNETIANLTLMALGSSAPEILINVLEVLLNNFYPGDLGPSTIVGSAAFNLMVISAVCVMAIPDGESRSIKGLGVFCVTASVRRQPRGRQPRCTANRAAPPTALRRQPRCAANRVAASLLTSPPHARRDLTSPPHARRDATAVFGPCVPVATTRRRVRHAGRHHAWRGDRHMCSPRRAPHYCALRHCRHAALPHRRTAALLLICCATVAVCCRCHRCRHCYSTLVALCR